MAYSSCSAPWLRGWGEGGVRGGWRVRCGSTQVGRWRWVLLSMLLGGMMMYAQGVQRPVVVRE